MKKEIIYSIKSPYRESLDVIGYTFGEGEKSCCIIGSMRGNEVEQMFVCSQLVKRLKKLEDCGKLVKGKSVTVIPCVNYYSMNISKRFWTMDNTDINRMFPGYDLGETTQRIADGLFSRIKDFVYGIQLASFYQEGEFLPHVKVMKTCLPNEDKMPDFGLPYGILRTPRPYDTTTLNYNWQIWDCHAFSLYATSTSTVDEAAAKVAVDAVMRFLTANGIVRWNINRGWYMQKVNEKDILQMYSKNAGIYLSRVGAGKEVSQGETLAEIIHPLEGYVTERVTAPCDGVVFFAYKKPLAAENTAIIKIIPY